MTCSMWANLSSPLTHSPFFGYISLQAHFRSSAPLCHSDSFGLGASPKCSDTSFFFFFFSFLHKGQSGTFPIARASANPRNSSALKSVRAHEREERLKFLSSSGHSFSHVTNAWAIQQIISSHSCQAGLSPHLLYTCRAVFKSRREALLVRVNSFLLIQIGN